MVRKAEEADFFGVHNVFMEVHKFHMDGAPGMFKDIDPLTEEEFKERGVNVVIYANQLTRSGFPAMQKTAETILKNHRAKEADDMCMSIQDIITLIPEI